MSGGVNVKIKKAGTDISGLLRNIVVAEGRYGLLCEEDEARGSQYENSLPEVQVQSHISAMDIGSPNRVTMAQPYVAPQS